MMRFGRENVLVLDFGGQYNQLIARRVREAKVYSEMISYRTPVSKIKAMNPKGIIFSGGRPVSMRKGRHALIRKSMP
jgi:GMP synthase (glutamine-hydrolysing)